MQVFEPGTAVIIGGSIEATVTAVTILSGQMVRYEVAWWSGSTRNNQWLEAHEVKARDEGTWRMTIGFGPGVG